MEKLKSWLRGMKQDSVLLVVILLAALACLAFSATEGGGFSDQETRLARVLSAMDGVGRTEVVIRTETVSQGASAVEKPVGAVVVADGASDVGVRITLTRAVTTLLDLPPSAVEVFSRAEGK